MNAAYRSAWQLRFAPLFAFCALLLGSLTARAQDDPFAPDAAKKPATQAPAEQEASPKAQQNPTIIRKVEEPVRKKVLLPHERKEIKDRLIREINAHLDAKETLQAQEKLAQLLDLDLSEAEVRDIRRRYSRFLEVETDQRVLEMRRRKVQGHLNLVEAIRRMLEINRADEAQKYFAQLMSGELTDKDRNEIYGVLGESFLRSLIRDGKLGVRGAEFAQNVIDTATSRNTTSSPVVAALRFSRTNTPADQLDSIDKLLRYGAISDAKEIAEQLAKREMTPEEMAELHEQVGGGPLWVLIRDKRLGDAPAKFAQKVLEASSSVARDPAKLSEAAKKLLTGDVAARRAAAADLVRGGEASAAVLLKMASDEASAARVEQVLSDLGENAVAPMIAALDSDQSSIREVALRVLAKSRDPQLSSLLLGRMFDERNSAATRAALEKYMQGSSKSGPSREIAKERLRQEWDRAFDALRPELVAMDTPIHEWVWSAEKQDLVFEPMTEGQARRLKLASAATNLLLVAPQDEEARRIAAMSLAEVLTADSPTYSIGESSSSMRRALESLPPTALEQGLVEGMRRNRTFALIGLLQLIGKVGDERFLIPTAGEPRIVSKLLGHPHPRVRAQAVETVLRLAPTAAFAGSSQLVEALRGFSRMRARPSVLVVDPKPSRAQQTAMLLRQAGWEAEVFLNEQELTRGVQWLPEVQIVLLSEEAANINEFLQRIRREPKLALTPVGVMAHVDNLPGASVLTTISQKKQPTTTTGGFARAGDTMLPVGLTDLIENPRKPKDWLNVDAMTRVVPYALNEEVLARMILQLSQLVNDAPLGPDDQLDLAVQSVRWMKYIAGNADLARIFDLEAVEEEAISALNDDALVADAVAVVGYLGRAKCQAALVNLANSDQREVAFRRAAAEALKVSVEKRGLLLAQGAIAQQYDRYNQSRDADLAIRQALGAVLDAIEIPWKKRQAVSAAPEPR
jgi:hypothetical protein